MAKTNNNLPDEIAKDFKLAKDAPIVFYHPIYGDVDFRSISALDADKLVELNCPFISKTKTQSSETAG